MSSHAGPSSSGKAKTNSKPKSSRPKAQPDAPPALSKATVESSGDEEDGSDDEEDDDDDDSSGEESPDSDEDLEGVQPRRRNAANTGGAALNGMGSGRPTKSLPRYTPPIGMSPLEVPVSFEDSPFEYEAMLKNPKLQLWAIRVPNDFKPSRLTSLHLPTPPPSSSSSSSATPQITGTLKTKSASYTLRSATRRAAGSSHMAVDKEGRQPTAGNSAVQSLEIGGEEGGEEGGGEMDGGMRLLVPRMSAGRKLVVAPIPISHHLILTPNLPSTLADPDEPTSSSAPMPLPSFLSTSHPTSTTAPADAPEGVLPAKRKQPTHLLKFRNKAFGFDTPGPGHVAAATETMDVDGEIVAEEAAAPRLVSSPEVKEKKEKEKVAREKKRKGDKADSPRKKAKKSSAAAVA